MKPYIEYEGKTYEFTANFKLQKEYRNEILRLQRSSSKKAINNNDLESINDFQKEVELLKADSEKAHLTEEETNSELLKIIAKYPNVLDLIESSTNEEIETLNEKYCRLSFELANPNNKDVFDKYIELLNEEKGVNYVIEFFNAVVKAVFTNVVEAPHQKPSFAWETKN